MKTTIVYGPQGCGKTTYAKNIATGLGCDFIVEEDQHFDIKRWFKLRERHRHILLLCITPETLPNFQSDGAMLIPFSYFKFPPPNKEAPQ